MNVIEMAADDVFRVIENTVGNLEKADLPQKGCLIVWQFSGKLRYVKDNVDNYLNSGECLVADLSSKYKFYYDGHEDASSAYFVSDGTLISDLLTLYHLHDGCVVPIPDTSGTLFQFQKLSGGKISDIKDKKNLSALYFHTVIVAIDMARKEADKKAKSTAALIKDYIDNHIESKLLLDDISEVFFISKTQIFRLFKEAYDIAPMQYSLHKKIELAKQLLTESNMHIADIADHLSFTDAKHFSKTFKKITGELPKNYRQATKSEKAQKKMESSN